MKALREDKTSELVRDDRAFDVQLVRSALDFFNGWAIPRGGKKMPLLEIVEGAYEWLPSVLEERARLVDVSANNVKWKGDTPYELEQAFQTVFMLLCGTLDFGRDLDVEVGVLEWGWAPDGTVMTAAKQLPAAEWFNRSLRTLPIYSRFLFDGRTVRRVSVPCITTVRRALAYAIAVLLEDRWQLRDRVRRCPYERRGLHFFLDYRLDKEGRLIGGQAQEYCDPKHRDAHRQQRWRDAHKETP